MNILIILKFAKINDWSLDKKRIGKGKKVPSGFIYSSGYRFRLDDKIYTKKWIKNNINQIDALKKYRLFLSKLLVNI